MANPELLSTKAKTAEQRRLELPNKKYIAKHKLKITSISEYEKHPVVNPVGLGDTKPIRFFPDGLEAVVNYMNRTNSVVNYALLTVEGKKQAVEFYYELPVRSDE
jgi:hypothetical protein